MIELPQAKDACIISTRSSITVSWKKPDHDDLTGYEISCFHIGKLDKKEGSLLPTGDQIENAASKDISRTDGQAEGGKETDRPAEEEEEGPRGGASRDLSEKDEDAVESSSELGLKKEENGDSGVSSEADEGKNSSPQKNKKEPAVKSYEEEEMVFTTIVDAYQTETVISGLKNSTEYRVEITSLCEELKSDVVILQAKTKSSEIVFGIFGQSFFAR